MICFASTSIVQITPLWLGDSEAPDGSYYKDLNNDLNEFEGVWEWSDGVKTLTIKLLKKENISNSYETTSEDLIIGEYKYLENGQVVMDYLSRLQEDTLDGRDHYISGSLLMANYHRPPCNNCQPDDKRLMLFWIDPEKRNLRSSSVLRRFQENGIEKLEMQHYLTYGEGSDQDLIPRIPYQTYIMTLQ